MNKRIRPVFGLAFLALLALLSCSSSPKEEFTPLDYSQEDVIQNEVSSITQLLSSQSVKALWRASLLKEHAGARNSSTADQVFQLCGARVAEEYHQAVEAGNYLEARRLLASLEAVDFSSEPAIFSQKVSLEEKILSATPGYGVQVTPDVPVSQYISGTVTVWVDLGIHVERGVGYANRAIGSGFFIDRRGYIITNYHVIQPEVDPKYEGYSRVYIKLSSDPDTRIPAKVVGWDPLLDLALLKAEIDAPYVFSLGSSQELDVGDKIFAIGSPAGLEWTITSGIVSAEGRRLLSMGPVMQIDAAINSGNSGGPIIDEAGNVQAIAFAGMLDFQGLNFAIPVEYLKLQLPLLAAGGLREHGWIGALGKDNEPDQFSSAPRGLLVQYLMPGGSGHRAGLQVGDIITAVNDIPVDGIDSFHNILKSMMAETILRLSVYTPQDATSGEEAAGRERICVVYLDKRPRQPGYEIYQRDTIGNAFLPILGMKLTPASDRNKKSYTVSQLLRGGVADESGFSVHDPVDILKVELSKEKDVLYAQLYTKKRKNGYFEVGIAVGSPLDSPFYF
ncbi:MAG: serine protease [Spirochaetaceae bacterium]|nr:serine protease [Spirochaetaceae bacterium]